MTGRWFAGTLLALSLFFSEFGASQTSAPAANPSASKFREIHVDASKVKGTIRSYQGVNGVPTPIMEGLPTLPKKYKELGIAVIRTHAPMGRPTFLPTSHWIIPCSPGSYQTRSSVGDWFRPGTTPPFSRTGVLIRI